MSVISDNSSSLQSDNYSAIVARNWSIYNNWLSRDIGDEELIEIDAIKTQNQILMPESASGESSDLCESETFDSKRSQSTNEKEQENSLNACQLLNRNINVVDLKIGRKKIQEKLCADGHGDYSDTSDSSGTVSDCDSEYFTVINEYCVTEFKRFNNYFIVDTFFGTSLKEKEQSSQKSWKLSARDTVRVEQLLSEKSISIGDIPLTSQDLIVESIEDLRVEEKKSSLLQLPKLSISYNCILNPVKEEPEHQLKGQDREEEPQVIDSYTELKHCKWPTPEGIPISYINNKKTRINRNIEYIDDQEIMSKHPDRTQSYRSCNTGVIFRETGDYSAKESKSSLELKTDAVTDKIDIELKTIEPKVFSNTNVAEDLALDTVNVVETEIEVKGPGNSSNLDQIDTLRKPRKAEIKRKTNGKIRYAPRISPDAVNLDETAKYCITDDDNWIKEEPDTTETQDLVKKICDRNVFEMKIGDTEVERAREQEERLRAAGSVRLSRRALELGSAPSGWAHYYPLLAPSPSPLALSLSDLSTSTKWYHRLSCWRCCR